MAGDWPWKLAVAVVTIVAASLIYSKRRRKWRPVGKLSKLYIYPLKSGKYREISAMECTPIGVRCPMPDVALNLRDRMFTIFMEEKMTLVTGRMYPTLLFVSTEPTKRGSVIFSHPKKEDIEVFIPMKKFDGETMTFFFNEKVQFVDCGDEIARWMSELTMDNSKGLRVGYWPEDETWRRDVLSVMPQERDVFKKFTNQGTGAYSDLASFMLMNQSSVDDLNRRLEGVSEKCEVLDFRPNFLVEGASLYDEDKWDRVKIGEVEFTNFRPCTRCIFTTINHRTGEKNQKMEPLKTMRSYRTLKMLGESRIDDNAPVMGIYMSLDVAGTVRAGDTVYVS